MDGWVNGYIYILMDGYMKGWMDACMAIHIDG